MSGNIPEIESPIKSSSISSVSIEEMNAKIEGRKTSLTTKICSAICGIVIVLTVYDIQFRESSIVSNVDNSRVRDKSSSLINGRSDIKREPIDSNDIQSMEKHQIVKFRNKIDLTVSQIYDYWNVSHYSKFLGMFDIPPITWDIQKNKFIKIILERKSNKSYVVGFSGSSVTAGHDNFFHHAYPSVFKETMSSIFAMMNVSLVVRNHAIGNNPCYPYDACVGTHLGEDLDLLSWEQSMNCGRDPKPVESFLRAAVEMPTKPTVLFQSSGTPVWTREECLNLNKSVPDVSDGTDALLSLASPARPSGRGGGVVDVLKKHFRNVTGSSPIMDNMLFLRTSSSTAAAAGKTAKSTASLRTLYAGLGIMAQTVLGIDAYKCRGPYGTDFCEKSLGGMGQTWHPGVRGHRLRADSLALVLLLLLDDALLDVYQALPVSIAAAGATSVADGPIADAVKPAAVSEGSGSTARKNLAINDIGGRGSLSNVLSLMREVTNKLADLQNQLQLAAIPPKVCQHEVCATTPKCFTNYEPRVKNAISEITVGSHNWTVELSFFDKRAVERSVKNNMGYLDRKIIFLSNFNSTLSLRIQTSKDSPIWLCEVQKGTAKYPSHIGELNAFADVALDMNVDMARVRASLEGAAGGAYSPRRDVVLQLTPAVEQCFKSTTLVPKGTHILSLSQRVMGKQVTLAYVLTW